MFAIVSALLSYPLSWFRPKHQLALEVLALRHQILVLHPFMTPSQRRFAPTTVRQARNGVRYGLEQVSAFSGIRIKDSVMTSFKSLPSVMLTI